MLHQAFERIAAEYPLARTQQFAGHSLANFIRHSVPTILQTSFPQHTDLLWAASAGKGQWPDAPWIAVFDPLVTENPQEGYYPVYLFSRTLDTVYLSLNQGMTELRKEFKSHKVKEILRNRAKILRSRVEAECQGRFDTSPINLQASGSSTRLAFYEPGHVFGVRYDCKFLPATQQLMDDLSMMIEFYRLATARGGIAELDHVQPVTDPLQIDLSGATLQEKRQYRYHRVIERNRRLASAAKQIQGYVCKVCCFDFEKTYGSVGREYIEAHHLVPISQLPLNQVMRLSPKDDFAVVCANCHRMIHRKGAPDTFGEFVKLYQEQKANVLVNGPTKTAT